MSHLLKWCSDKQGEQGSPGAAGQKGPPGPMVRPPPLSKIQ